MRHQKAGRKLSRTASHRKAMLRNMLASMFAQEKIETTTPKAKELKPLAEKMITLGKRGDLHARRRVLSLIPDRKIVHKLFEEIAPRYQNRNGGYTRIVRAGYRAGDNAPLSVIELVQEELQGKKKTKKRKGASKAKPDVKKEQGAVEPKTAAKAKSAEESQELPRKRPPEKAQAAESFETKAEEKAAAEEKAEEMPADEPEYKKAETEEEAK